MFIFLTLYPLGDLMNMTPFVIEVINVSGSSLYLSRDLPIFFGKVVKNLISQLIEGRVSDLIELNLFNFDENQANDPLNLSVSQPSTAQNSPQHSQEYSPRSMSSSVEYYHNYLLEYDSEYSPSEATTTFHSDTFLSDVDSGDIFIVVPEETDVEEE